VTLAAAALFADSTFEREIDPIAKANDLAAQGDEAERLAVELVNRPPSLGIAPNVLGDLACPVEGLTSRVSGKAIGHVVSSAELYTYNSSAMVSVQLPLQRVYGTAA
jgi:hypothetical protein